MARFRVDQTSNVIAALKSLRDRLRRAGRSSELAASLNQVIARLRTNPHQVGEVIRTTRKEGGRIHFAIVENFAIHFAIFSRERVVLVYRLEPYGDKW